MKCRRHGYGLARNISFLVLSTILAFGSMATAQPISSLDYFPDQPGNSWKYRVNGTHTESAQVLSGTVNVEGVETSVLQSSPTGLKAFVTSDSDGVRLHRLLLQDYPIPGLGNVTVTMTLMPPLVLVDDTITPGQTFNSSGIMRTNSLPIVGIREFPYSSSFTYNGFDVVTVPAGTFDAIWISGTLTVQGQVGSVVIYAARDLGVVKATATNSLIPDASLELISTNAGHVTLLTPNGAEVLPSGSTFPISWEASADAVRLQLRYSLDDGVTWVQVPGADNLTVNSFDWNVPAVQGNKKKSRIKVIGYNALGGKVGADNSDGPFTIEVVKLTAPNGEPGQVLTSGAQFLIAWTVSQTIRPTAKIALVYTIDGGVTWKSIANLAGGQVSHLWTVPTVKKAKSQSRVKVVLKDAQGVTIGSDVSDNYFTISPSP